MSLGASSALGSIGIQDAREQDVPDDRSSSMQHSEESLFGSETQSDVEISEQTLRKNASQKSLQTQSSTDEGSCSCGSDSTPSSNGYQVAVSAMDAAQDNSQGHHPDSLPKPLWMSNSLKGEAAAWLLVLPKSHCQNNQFNSSSLPRSPHDTVLLGPYVFTKNTFLDEDQIECSLRFKQRFRSRSIGACRSGLS